MDQRLDPARFWSRLHGALDRVDEDARTPPPGARVGAVLVLFEETEVGPQVVLTRRRRDLPSHPGQVSFAGGRLDEDETVEEAALREGWEEIGVRPDTVETVGVGPKFFIPPSRFWVVPVLARWHQPHELAVNPWEVEKVLRVPLAELLRSERWRHVLLSDRGSSWAWQLDDGDLLWGATAIVMALVLDIAVEGWSGGLAPEDLPGDREVRPWEHAPPWRPRPHLPERPQVAQDEVPHVTAEQMRTVDGLLADVGLPLETLVEHAGRGIAEAARGLLGGDVAGRSVTVLAGGGGNGAGGLAAARLLAVAGADVQALTTATPRLAGQVTALEAAGVRVAGFTTTVTPGDLVVDAMVGYSARPPLRGAVEDAVTWLRRHDVPVVAVDLPSGLLADSGLHGPCVNADVTVTLAAPKTGLRPRSVHPYVGDLYLADLGVPPALWSRVGVAPVDVFGRGALVRLVRGEVASDAGTPDQADAPPAAPD